jgi:hypothetical protein
MFTALLVLAQSPTDRTFNQTIESASLPKISISVSPKLSFLGSGKFDVRGIAAAEQFVFAEADRGVAKRVFIAHFEHWLPTNTNIFDYPKLRQAKVGSHEYLHQIWYIEKPQLLHSGLVSSLLKQRGLSAEDNWMMNRYVRAVDEAKRHEIILFYLEPASSFPKEASEFKPGPPVENLPQFLIDFVGRANTTFSVRD